MSVVDPHTLPPPSPDLCRHSEALVNRIVDRIHSSGPLGFSGFMTMALYEPGLGYYSAGSRKFGPAGDFVTAPEVSSLFSGALANQCREILIAMPNAVILEFGAGSGRMAADLLQRLASLDCLPGQYLIMETSADLRQRQQALLADAVPDYYTNIVWLDTLPDEPLDVIILANEVLDALPFDRVMIRDGKLFEQVVDVDNGDLVFDVREAGSHLRDYCRFHNIALENYPDGYTTELHSGYAPWLGSLAVLLERGVMLLVDYGYVVGEYYAPDRSAGTLMCHYRHRAHDDPFYYPGLQDITASVNFSAVDRLAADFGLERLGYTNQAGFLLSCGLDELYAQRQCDDAVDQYQLNREVRSLTMPGEMGERFQVMALGRGLEMNLQGFTFRDFTYRL